MDSTTLTIILFLLAGAITFGNEVLKAKGKRRIPYAVLAAAFVIAAILWIPIAKASPSIARIAGQIVSTPSTWFTVVVVLGLVAHHWWARRAFRIEQESALYPMGIGAEALEGIEALSIDYRELSKKHDALKAALAENQTATEARDARLSLEMEALTGRVEGMATSILAIGHREYLAAKGKAVNDIALRLSLDTQQQAESQDWDEWWRLEEAFRSDLDNWIMLARIYDDQVREKIYVVSEETYLDQRWTLKRDAFPSHDAMTRYRTFRTIYGQWIVQEEAIRWATSKLAYGY